MNKTKLLFYGFGVCTLSAFALFAWPLFINSRRPHQITFDIQTIYPQTPSVAEAFNIGGMTRTFVVAEGPCGDQGCNGGILAQQLPADVKSLVPNLKDYDSKSTTILWLYQVKPTKVTRTNDLFGEDKVTINGILTQEPKTYFALVPKSLVEPELHWVYVETK